MARSAAESFCLACSAELLSQAAQDRTASITTRIHDSVDVITDFMRGAGGDILDISDVLVGYTPGASNVSDFVRLSGGADTTVSVNADGAGSDFAPVAILQNVVATGTLFNDMLAQGNLAVA